MTTYEVEKSLRDFCPMDMLDPGNVKGEFLKPQKIGDSPIIFTVPKNTGTKARQRNFRLVASMALILHPSSI